MLRRCRNRGCRRQEVNVPVVRGNVDCVRRPPAQHPARRQAGTVEGDGDVLGILGVGRGRIGDCNIEGCPVAALPDGDHSSARRVNLARGRNAPCQIQIFGRGGRSDNLQPDELALACGSGQARPRKLDIADVVVVQGNLQSPVRSDRIALGKTRNPVSRTFAVTVRILQSRNPENDARRIRGIDDAASVGNVASVGRKRAGVVRSFHRVAGDAHGNYGLQSRRRVHYKGGLDGRAALLRHQPGGGKGDAPVAGGNGDLLPGAHRSPVARSVGGGGKAYRVGLGFLKFAVINNRDGKTRPPLPGRKPDGPREVDLPRRIRRDGDRQGISSARPVHRAGDLDGARLALVDRKGGESRSKRNGAVAGLNGEGVIFIAERPALRQ